jgi:hypothetical protein
MIIKEKELYMKIVELRSKHKSLFKAYCDSDFTYYSFYYTILHNVNIVFI